MIVTQCKDFANARISRLLRPDQAGNEQSIGKSLEETLSFLPVTDKKYLSEYTQIKKDNLLQECILFSETSGSTGTPLMTPRNPVDLAWNVNNQAESYRDLIQSGKDRVAIISPGILSPFIEASAFALNLIGVGYVRIYPIPGVCDYERMNKVINEYQITTIMTTPSLIMKYIYESKKRNLVNKFNKILLTGERIPQSFGDNIRRILGDESIEVIPFVYGSSETATLMKGTKDFIYKSFDKDFVFELLDPVSLERSQPVYDESDRKVYEGCLVVTWLRDGALPVLRYNTKDIFELEVTSSGKRTWKYIKRYQDSNNGFDENTIENIMYSSDVPVFCFRCEVSSNKIDIKVLPYLSNDVNYFNTDKIYSLIRNSYCENSDISIDVVDNLDGFSGDFITPKINKFVYHENS